MDAVTAGLIGAALGAGVTILNSLVVSYTSRRLEAVKAQWARASTLDAELRAHVATVARELLSAQHSMEWLCSLTDGGALLGTPDVTAYHAEVHATFPRLLGALASVASLNEEAYDGLLALADRVFVIDRAIADALRSFPLSAPTASAKVAEQREAATNLYGELPREVSKIMKKLRQ